MDQQLTARGDVKDMDRLARLRALGGEDDQAIGGSGSVHRREQAIADGRALSVVGLHRAVCKVMLQAVDDDALVGLQIIAEVRAEVPVDEDDAGGIEGQAGWKCDGRITLGRGIRLVEQLGHAGVFPRFGPDRGNGQRVHLRERFGGARP
ncbi:MAG: hypothetical protein IPO90_17605 [Flavobacteriales bacterium]|nr:hypothetical protein [Flavobacteriales bacterium]